MVYQVGRPAMFDGNMFLPPTGTPIWKMDRRRTRLAVWLPDPLTVATWMAKSLTMRSVRASWPASWTATSVTDIVSSGVLVRSLGSCSLPAAQPHKLQRRLQIERWGSREVYHPALKQLHLDQFVRVDDFDCGRDFDVAVRLRHRGDVARCFEGRHRDAVLDAHRIELMPSGHGCDSRGERERERTNDLVGQAGDAPQRRSQQDVGVRQAGRGIARHSEDQLAVDASKRRGLSRLHRDPVEQHLAFRGDHIQDEIAFTDGAAAREHQQVLLETLVHRARQILDRV